MSGRVVVLGSVNVDLFACASRLPLPGETIAGDRVLRELGGKGANQAVAASRAGAETMLIGALGADSDGDAMAAKLECFGIGVGHLARVSAPTGCAVIITSPQDNQIVVIPGANHLIAQEMIADIPISPRDVCLAQMETPADVTADFFRNARAQGAVTLLNAAPASETVRPMLALVDVLIVNESELSLLSGRHLRGDASDTELQTAVSYLELASATTVVVTLGPRGAAIVRAGDVLRIPGRVADVVDTTGAGDCFCGYFATGLARGSDLELAATEANVAASIAVGSLGAAASIPSRVEVMSRIASDEDK